MSSSVKFWPQSEQPRERLKEKGVVSLSNAELIALVLRSGDKESDVLSFSRHLLDRFGSLRNLLNLDWSDLEQVKGLGPAKIASLQAASELGRRVMKEDLVGKHYFKDIDDVLSYIKASLGGLKREVFKVIYLDSKHSILSEMDLFQGSIDRSVVYPREIIKSALDCHASAIILVHNHPSGHVQPSLEDKRITKKLSILCSEISIKVLDHVIIGYNKYFSFREYGMIQ